MSLKINKKAPDFTLPSTEGKDFTLSKDAAGKPLILYFYPKDFTKVCTKEACEFRDQFETFKDLDIMIYGISTDDIETHQRFRKQHQLPFHLLADPKGEVSRLYKAKVPILNMSKRITYLIDKEHKIQAAYKEMFGFEGHIRNMVEELRG
ncbi:MAG: peroxiredoxin [Candidatus Cyclobacteriaceae bacterium M2_1C_046]